MDTERTPEEIGQQSDKPDATNTHWDEWEIGCLLSRFRDDRSLDEIAHILGRSVAACKRMLTRLVSTETPCPEQYKSTLKDICRKAQDAKAKRHTHPREHGKCREEIHQQYLTLAKNNEAIKAILAEVETLQVYLLALEVIEGHTTLREIRDYNTGRVNISVQNVVNKIRGIRQERGDLFDKSMADETGRTVSCPNPPTGDKPTTENPQSADEPPPAPDNVERSKV